MEESSISSNVLVHGYGNHTEDCQMSEHFWNFLTKEESKEPYYEKCDVETGVDTFFRNDYKDAIVYEKAEIKDCTDYDHGGSDSDAVVAGGETDDDEVESSIDTRFRIEDFQDVTADEVPESDDSDIQVPHGNPIYYCHAYAPNSPMNHDDHISKFIKATRKGEWDVMEKIATAHNDTLTKKWFDEGTALHHTLLYGQDRVDIAKGLVKLMTPNDLETKDKEGYTPLALAVLLHHDNDLLSCMIDKNGKLLRMGESDKIPVVLAASKGFRDTTEFLYDSTDEEIFGVEYVNRDDSNEDPTPGRVGINLLNQCISLNLFDIATKLLKSNPKFLRQWDDHCIYPLHALAKAMAALHEKSSNYRKLYGRDQESAYICEAYELLRLIIRVEDFDINIDNAEYIVDAVMEAAKHGIVKFIAEMLKENRELIGINKDGKNIFWYAIMNRQEKVFNLVYAFYHKKDMLLSFDLDDEGNPVKDGNTKKIPNVLHFAACLPPPLVLDRISDPVLQMQREVRWFKAVQDVTKPRYREDLNESGHTPYALFVKTHKDLSGEVATFMKSTATAGSTISSLIVTIMFAAALAVIIGIYQTEDSENLPVDMIVFFVLFLVLAAQSFCSGTSTFILFFTSSYSFEDFLFSLPRKLTVALWLLFGALINMMLSFSCALYTMLKDHRLRYVIIPIFFVSLVPLVLFVLYISPLLCNIYRSRNELVVDSTTTREEGDFIVDRRERRK